MKKLFLVSLLCLACVGQTVGQTAALTRNYTTNIFRTERIELMVVLDEDGKIISSGPLRKNSTNQSVAAAVTNVFTVVPAPAPVTLTTNVVARQLYVWEEVRDEKGGLVSVKKLGARVPAFSERFEPEEVAASTNVATPAPDTTKQVKSKTKPRSKKGKGGVQVVTAEKSSQQEKEVFLYGQAQTNYIGDGHGEVVRYAPGTIQYPGAGVAYSPQEMVPVVNQSPVLYAQAGYIPTPPMRQMVAPSYPHYRPNPPSGYRSHSQMSYGYGGVHYENRRLFGVNYVAAVNPYYTGRRPPAQYCPQGVRR